MFRNDRSNTHFPWRGLAVALAASLLLPQLGFGAGKILDVHQALPDFDSREGSSVPPSSQAVSIVQSLGAKASWNSFGTPRSLVKHGGFLATGLSGTPVTAAKNWIRTNKALFRLSDAGVDSLELAADTKMSGYDGHAVIFRQKFGSLPAAQDGLITVSITGGKIAYVSSSSVGDQNPPGSAVLSATAAWILAAIDVGRVANAGDLSSTWQEGTWTVFDAEGFSHAQRSRLVGFPTPTSGVRPAFETIVLDVQGGASTAYTHFVDAQTGQVLFRQNKVQQVATGLLFAPQTSIFTGTYTDTPAPQACGPLHPFVVPAGIFSIDVAATEAVIGNDIVLWLYGPGSGLPVSADTATSPEVIHYEPGGAVTPGTYNVQVCPFASPTAPPQAPYNYAGIFTTNDVTGVPDPAPYPPKWKVFPANPKLSVDLRKVWCWENPIGGDDVADCQNVHPEKKELFNLAARSPWDVNPLTNLPSFTTIGNAAITAEAWGSPLTPAEPYRPVDPNREYIFDWTDQWRLAQFVPTAPPGCSSPGVFASPERNDIDAAVTNLFGMHNRLHDWAYFLGFTERNFNAQLSNFGNSGAQSDPEVGNAQAGAASGGFPSFLGRDNANQITLNDGVPPITNMYLWQPIAGAFYAPCVDGDYDMSIIGHEYTHLISNRMVGGPDGNLSGHQAGSMGESWGDLNAVEYLNEYGFVPVNGENKFSVGSYATGNKTTGIRNYSMDANPLNYSDVGYDVGGAEVHSDGEIWDAVNFDVRASLIAKYNGSFPASNAVMQRECADAIRPSYLCPGNRRWIQIVFDAWLTMQPGVSMLDARDAYLAADNARATGTPGGGWPSNQAELWKAFARRGMGENALSADTNVTDPIPNFESPHDTEKTVTFRVFAADEGNAPIANWKVYVGYYESGATPIADTDGSTPMTNVAKFASATYQFLVVAPGYGHLRFPRFFTVGGSMNLDIYMSTNRASSAKGAVATGTGTSISNLIDDTEGSNWVGGPPATNLEGVIVDLQGGVQNVKKVNVSAMLNASSGGRFTALRKFEIQTCTQGVPVPTCALPTDFTTIPGASYSFVGTVPRPTAPQLILKSFDVQDTNATHVRLKVISNQCTEPGTAFRGEQDNDLANITDCVDGSPIPPDTIGADDEVRAAELQVFASTPPLPPQDPAVVFTMTAPATAASGTNITYTMTYTNAGPAAASNARITDVLPTGLTFVSASNGGTYNPGNRTVTWNLGTVNVGFTGNRSLTTTVSGPGSVIVNTATFTADLTAATPAAAVTTVTP